MPALSACPLCGSIRKTNSFANPKGQKNYQYAQEDKSKDSYFSLRHKREGIRRHRESLCEKREPGELTSPALFVPFAYRAGAGFSCK
jgi:hypothetical protein